MGFRRQSVPVGMPGTPSIQPSGGAFGLVVQPVDTLTYGGQLAASQFVASGAIVQLLPAPPTGAVYRLHSWAGWTGQVGVVLGGGLAGLVIGATVPAVLSANLPSAWLGGLISAVAISVQNNNTNGAAITLNYDLIASPIIF